MTPVVPPVYQKLGPGYSVINSDTDNQSNQNLQMFKDLAQNIEQTMNEEIASIDKEVNFYYFYSTPKI